MVRYLFFIFIISIGSVLVSFKGKKYEEGIPITIATIITVLYSFYIFNMLKIGYYSIVLTIITLYGYAFYKFIKSDKKKTIIKNIFSPGFVIFILSLFIIYIITRNNMVLLWDELRLWGAYPKVLFYSEKLQLGSSSQLMNSMESYEPGMPLFQYFFCKTNFRFIERDLFISYAIVGLSIFMPLCKKIEWKKWYLIPIMVLMFTVFPYVINNNGSDGLAYYYTLFIEPILGMFFGYAIFLSSKRDKSKFHYLSFISSVSILVLLKDTGVFFALIATLAFCINQIFIIKQIGKKKIIMCLMSIVFVLMIFFSWKIVQNVYKTNNLYANNTTKDEIEVFFNGGNETQKLVINEFKRSLKKEPLYSNDGNLIAKHINVYTLGLSIVVLLIIAIISSKKDSRKLFIISSIFFLVGCVLFVLGYYAMCLFTFEGVVSFSRYMSTIFVGGIILLFFMIINESFERNSTMKILGIYFAFFILLVYPFSKPKTFDMQVFINYRNSTNEYVECLKGNINSKEKNIVLVFGDQYRLNYSDIIYHHNIYFGLLDSGYKFFPEIYAEENIMEDLKYYEYVYFIAINNDDIQSFKAATGMEFEKSELFKISNDGEKVVMERVN